MRAEFLKPVHTQLDAPASPPICPMAELIVEPAASSRPSARPERYDAAPRARVALALPRGVAAAMVSV